MKIALVVPIYNEEKHISSVSKDLIKTGHTVIFIDDGSVDDTPKVLRTLRNKKKAVVLTHEINLGKGAAMKTGCEYAFTHGFDAVIFMDSDNQHDIRDLSHFEWALKNGSQIVYGSRNMHMGMPLVRYIGNKVASILVNQLFGVYISDILCGYRAITKKVYGKIKWESQGYGVETEMIVRAAKKDIEFTEVPVKTLYHDSFKGVTIMDSFGILMDLIRWRIKI